MDSLVPRGYRQIEIVNGRRAFDESVKNRDLAWPIWKKTVNTYYMSKERREKVDRKDKIMVVTFLNSQFEKAIVQFLRGHNDNEQY